MQYPYFTLDSLTELIRNILGIRNSVRINETSINSIMNRLSLLSRRLEIAEDKADIKFVDDTTVDNAYINTDKNLIVSDLTMTSLVGSSWALIGSSVNVSNSTANSVSIATTAINGDVAIDGLTTTGSITKSVSNAAIKVSTNENVVITNSNIGQSGYNSIEIGLVNSVSKSVLIKGCDFSGNLSNNAISIFALTDNTVVNIEDCHFASVSNVIRWSNRTNATGIVFNIKNCTWDSLEPDENYRSVFLLQDYTSANSDAVYSNNRFSADKLIINFLGCTGTDGELISLADGEDATERFGTGDGKLAYLYADKIGKISYQDHPEMYPIINVIDYSEPVAPDPDTAEVGGTILGE
jgi:hypothetical protein